MVLICGAGVNAAGVAPDGRVVRLAALGNISGDAGGGRDLGMAALGAAVRARDGRGPRTIFERLVPQHFGFRRPEALTRAFYDGRIDEERLRELAPVVFAAARDGDAVARSILDAMADELATMATAMQRVMTSTSAGRRRTTPTRRAATMRIAGQPAHMSTAKAAATG